MITAKNQNSLRLIKFSNDISLIPTETHEHVNLCKNDQFQSRKFKQAMFQSELSRLETQFKPGTGDWSRANGLKI